MRYLDFKTAARATRRSRRVALLGGTATLADSLVALAYLANPKCMVRGPAIDAYEREFARVIGVPHALSFSAARVGLYGLLRALGVGAGDEVLLQVPTHIVVSNAIRYTGARPIFVDCRPGDYNMDIDLAARRTTPRTKALLLQHTFGIPADLDGALRLSQGRSLFLIEDCVHALGAKYGGKPVGSFGDAAIFSTEETKMINSIMGGVVVTRDDALAAKLAVYQKSCSWPDWSLAARYAIKFLLSYFFTEPHVHRFARPLYEWLGKRQPIPSATSEQERVGEKPEKYESRLSNVQAALALRQLKRLDSNVAHRRAVAHAYGARLAASGFEVPRIPSGTEPAFLRYPVAVSDPMATVKRAGRHGIVGTWFTSVLEEAVSPETGGYEPGSCPRAELASRHLVNLPTHARVSESDSQALLSSIIESEAVAEIMGRKVSRMDGFSLHENHEMPSAMGEGKPVIGGQRI